MENASHWGQANEQGAETRFFAAATGAYGALSCTRGFIMAVELQKNAQRAQLEQAKKNLQKVVLQLSEAQKLGRIYLRTPDDHDSEEAIRVGLAAIAHCIEGLNTLIGLRQSLGRKTPMIESYWPARVQEAFVEGVEFLENMQETLALGLNESFHKDVEAVREEAGIVSRSAEHGLPTE